MRASFEPALEQLEDNLEAIETELPEDAPLLADAGYFSEGNVRTTVAHGLDPHLATGRFKHSEPQPPARRGPIPKHVTPKQRMARKLQTKRGRSAYARRKTIVEPVFGQMDTAEGAAIAPARQGRGAGAVALSLRDPQPAQAPSGRRSRPGRRHIGPSGPGFPDLQRSDGSMAPRSQPGAPDREGPAKHLPSLVARIRA